MSARGRREQENGNGHADVVNNREVSLRVACIHVFFMCVLISQALNGLPA